jgi:hypothetical protein
LALLRRLHIHPVLDADRGLLAQRHRGPLSASPSARP